MRRHLVPMLALMVSACASTSAPDTAAPLAAAIDLPRFMGRWYVIAAIPLYPECKAFNATETYTLNSDGSIATEFRQRKGSFDEPVTTYHPTGFVQPDSGNALWKMQFIWPLKGEYRIAFVEPDYSATIIARSRRDYVWIMARTPQIPAASYDRYVQRIEAMGYDVGKIRKVPQQWPETAAQ